MRDQGVFFGLFAFSTGVHTIENIASDIARFTGTKCKISRFIIYENTHIDLPGNSFKLVKFKSNYSCSSKYLILSFKALQDFSK